MQKSEKIDEIPPTVEQINKIEKMGIRIKPKENIIDVFINELEKLQSIEIDISKIQVKDTILDLVKKTKTKENDEELIKKIEEIELDPNENIGGRLCRIKMGYKKRQKEGNSRWTLLTEEQLNKIQGMGIKIGKEITGKSIGQASYTATAQECGKAKADLDRLIQEEQTKEGGQEQND